jgi:hypothetical protein
MAKVASMPASVQVPAITVTERGAWIKNVLPLRGGPVVAMWRTVKKFPGI